MPTTVYVTPSTANYHIAKGKASFKEDGLTTFRDLGMLKNVSRSFSSSKIEHTDTREGVGVVDFSVPTKLSQTLKITMNEIIPENMAIANLGGVVDATDGTQKVTVFTDVNKQGLLKFEGTNDYGAKITYYARVQIQPEGDFTLLDDSEQLTDLTFSAQVLKDTTYGYGVYIFP